MKKTEKSIELGGRKLTLSTGYLAKQASGAVLATYGETVVLATVVAAPLTKDWGYFPLTIDYMEKLYAGGKIKGSRWIKREGRPSDEEILTSRLIDRSIRPLFDKYYKKELQVMITVLSVDLENAPDVLAGIATSAAISVSEIPWEGPVAVVRVGLKNDEFVLNPIQNGEQNPTLDLIVSSTSDSVVMIEAGANQVPEKKIIGGIEFAQKESNKIIKLINELQKEAGQKKEETKKHKSDLTIEKKVEELSKDKIESLIKNSASKEGSVFEFNEVKNAVCESFDGGEKEEAAISFEELYKKKVRSMILSGKRPDGRKHDEIRELSCQVSVLPRTHGSAIFNRGQTQALTITTLGAPSLVQLIESAEGEETKRYIHHYAMPPFSMGEVGKVGSPNRREIGHGALAERALLPVIPTEEEFPYTIRVVTEILSSNGSTSMASTCGSTLSLMDAGVPIKAPVAGIAMGLIFADDVSSKKTSASVLTDIVGVEDGYGDMDFKVAGTQEGITALQLDVKTLKLTIGVLEKALDDAKKARLTILDLIKKTLSEPRDKVSVYAPKIKVVKIPVDKIGELIGPGGRIIKGIIAETGAVVDVEDDGTVSISGISDENVQSAFDKVNLIVKEPKPGEVYEGIVRRIQPFGAFVEILPGKDGLVHVSDMSTGFVKDPRDIVNEGDKVSVRVKEVDDLGRLNLSMVLDPGYDKEKEERRQTRRNDRSEGDRFGRHQGNYQRHDRDSDRDRNKGPHFPTSRLLDEVKKD